MKILIAELNYKTAALEENKEKIAKAILNAQELKLDLVLTSEMALTGYPPEDFLLLPHFIQEAEKALITLAEMTTGITAVIGTVRKNSHKGQKELYNTAAVCQNGKIIGYQDKTLLPTYDVFDERRYFAESPESHTFEINGQKVGITICEDIWQLPTYEKKPLENLAKKNIDLLLNLSSSPYHKEKLKTRLKVCENAVKVVKAPLVFCNQVGGNDSLIFDGRSLVISKEGNLAFISKGFEESLNIIDTEHLPQIVPPKESLEDLKKALVLGIKDYFHKQGFKKACLGLSGGVDSALVASLAKEALGKDNVLAVLMPSCYSSEGSITDAMALANNLNIKVKVIPIDEPFNTYLTLLNPHFEGKKVDTTEENLQARIRGMILMALSNKLSYIVLSTGNKSELALGYSTLYGDLCGGLAVISDLTKEDVYALCDHINKDKEIIPKTILEKPPSAELAPGQKDSDSLPPYPLIDKVLKGYIEEGLSAEKISEKNQFDLQIVKSLIHKIHASEYKRRQAPPGLRVTEKAFSVGRRFPIVQGFEK